MAGKSRRKKGKQSPHSRKSRQHFGAVVAQQTAVTRTQEPVASPDVPVPSASAPTSMAKPAAVQYPYIATELRFIGILAGLMLIILIVLALVLS